MTLRWADMAAWLRSTGLILVAFALGSCGGSSSESVDSWGLWCESRQPVAGVQWLLAGPDPWSGPDAVLPHARAALGSQARVLVRASTAVRGAEGRDWVVWSPASPGATRWLVAKVERDPFVQRLNIGDVMCADRFGNPVACTLNWSRL